MSDAIVRASDTHYGHAGRAFLEQLTRDQRDWEAQYTALKRAPEFTAEDRDARPHTRTARTRLDEAVEVLRVSGHLAFVPLAMPALFGPCQAAWTRRLVEFSIAPTITLTTTNTAPIVQTVMVAQSARVQISRSVRLVNKPEM
jgi:hypothetical protein